MMGSGVRVLSFDMLSPSVVTASVPLVEAIIIVLTFCYSRFTKFKEYYTKTINDIVSIISVILVISLFIIFSQALLSIPTNLVIKLYSKNNEVEYQNCEIQNVITTGVDLKNCN